MSPKPESTEQNRSGRLALWATYAAVPSLLISLLVHALALGFLATIGWTVHQVSHERQFTVGIVVKKNTADGAVFQDQERTYESARPDGAQRPEALFVPDRPPEEFQLPELTQPDLSAIGVSGSLLSGVGQMLSVPDPAAGTGLMATTEFFGAQVQGNMFVYVIDRSGSMSLRDMLSAAKRELLASLDQLPVASRFQVIFYNINPRSMPSGGAGQKLLVANQSNKIKARRFLDTIVADGRTEHSKALEAALKLRPDVIFFLTDADDMRQRHVRLVTGLNQGRSRIHTIEFGLGPDSDQQTALRKLAGANGGTYRYIDTAGFGQK